MLKGIPRTVPRDIEPLTHQATAGWRHSCPGLLLPTDWNRLPYSIALIFSLTGHVVKRQTFGDKPCVQSSHRRTGKCGANPRQERLVTRLNSVVLPQQRGRGGLLSLISKCLMRRLGIVVK